MIQLHITPPELSLISLLVIVAFGLVAYSAYLAGATNGLAEITGEADSEEVSDDG